MSMTVWDMRIPCDADPECAHKICHVCEHPIRSHDQHKHDHPGAKPGHIRNRLCDRCMIEGHKPIHDTPPPEPEPLPETLEDERHILIDDDTMFRMMAEHPTQFSWHAQRRKRLKLGEYS